MARVFLEYQGDNIELPVGETVIGRDVSCTLRFNDPSVSRRHVRLVRRHDHVFVQDLGSTNGTTINGREVIGAVRVTEGDELVIGARHVIVRFARDAEREPDTLSLKDFSVPEQLARARQATTRLPATVPPPNVPAPIAAVGSVGHRRHDRHRAELQVVYISDALEIEATSRDLSMSGVFVCTQLLDPVGTSCQLTLLVDGGPPLQLGAMVRRVVEHDPLGDEPVGMGVEFVQLGGLERAWLERTVERVLAS